MNGRQSVESVTPIDDRLLEIAIEQFGRKGMDGASTRAIAAAAGTAMSSITYHFGGKEGLYLAAARHIAAQVSMRLGDTLEAAQAKSDGDDSVESAIEALLMVVDRFAAMMVMPESAAWARFVVREQMEPTEAFDILFENVMGPIAMRGTGLLVRISGGRLGVVEARLKLIAIFGQTLVMRISRAALMRLTGWTEIGPDEAAEIRRTVRAHTLAILDSIRRGQA